MGLVTRPIKGGGTSQYVTEVAAGFEFAEASEVDADLNTLYTVVNGNLDNANIKLGANIDGGKLAVGTVNGDRLTGLSVPGSALQNLTVGIGKIAVGSGVWQFVAGSANNSPDWTDGNTVYPNDDKFLAEITWAPRSPSAKLLAIVHVDGKLAATMSSVSGYVGMGLTWKLMSGGTAGHPTDGTQVDATAEHGYLVQPQSAGYPNLTWPVAAVLAWGGITADTRLRLVCHLAQSLGVNSHFTIDVTGRILLVEFA